MSPRFLVYTKAIVVPFVILSIYQSEILKSVVFRHLLHWSKRVKFKLS